MMDTLQRIQNLSMGMRAAAGLASLGVLAAATYFLPARYRFAIFMILAVAGLAAIAVLALFKLFKSMREKRRAQQLEGAVLDNTAAGAASGGDASERARVDQLRTDFQRGLKVYRDRGKDLYTVPWLLQVGEPGSGKTEAIRHSDIGFPSGLNEPNQGSGGTLNMDWWFTNNAVIVDTAGRLMFQDTREWRELLDQLKRARTQCPINGLLLFIPADSLLQDPLEEIHTKAGRIAQQLETLQRSLDVRFPVYVIISKSDKLTGFGQFFSQIDDPDLQHQMVGWSNPDPLDAAFQPEVIDKHLSTVHDRLVRRRLDLLLDPPLVDETSDKRLDQLDALYAFPDQLTRIAPRLKRYLETIFTPSEWSSKPLFLRGIYFTSSLQTGERLDSALAEMLGIEVKALPEPFSRSRAYFLRDLFTKKVFPERGLVTRAVNAAKSYHTRRRLVLGATAGAMVFFLALFVWSLVSFRSSIGQQHDWWAAMQANWNNVPQIVESREYRGERSLTGLPGNPRLVDAVGTSGVRAEEELRPRGVLRIPALFAGQRAGDLEQNLQGAHQALVRNKVLDPLLKHATDRLMDDRLDWPEEGAAALAEMIRSRYSGAPSLAALYPVLRVDALPREADAKKLQESVDRAYRFGQLHGQVGREDLRSMIVRWGSARSGGLGFAGSGFREVEDLAEAMARFEATESRLQQIAGTGDPCRVDPAEWSVWYSEMSAARDSLDAARTPFGAAAGAVEAAASRVKQAQAGAGNEYRALRQAMGLPAESVEDEVAPSEVGPLADALDKAWSDIEGALVEAGRHAQEIESRRAFLARTGAENLPGYEARFAAYALANAQFSAQPPDDLALLSLGEYIKQIEGKPMPGSVNSADHDRLIRCVVTAAREHHRRVAAVAALDRAPVNIVELERAVERAAENDDRLLPRIPLTALATGGSYAADYSPTWAAKLFAGWDAIAANASDKANTGHFASVRSAVDGYRANYCRYWSEDGPGLGRVTAAETWPAFRAATNFRVGDVHTAFIEFTKFAANAAQIGACPVPDCGSLLAAYEERRFFEDLNNLIDGWHSMGASTDDARRRFLGLGRTADYFPPIEFNHDCVPNYWRDFVLAAMGTLAGETASLVRKDLDELADLATRFPLARDGASELNRQQLEKAQTLLEQIQSRLRIGSEVSGTIPEWAKEAYGKLWTPLPLGAHETNIISSGHELASAIVSAPLRLTLEGGTAMEQYRQVEIVAGGQSRRLMTRTAQPPSMEIDLPVDGPLTFRFFRDVGAQKHDAEVPYDSAWTLLRAFARARPEQSAEFQVTVNEEGDTYNLSIELTPGTGASLPSEWPSRAQWDQLLKKVQEYATTGGRSR